MLVGQALAGRALPYASPRWSHPRPWLRLSVRQLPASLYGSLDCDRLPEPARAGRMVAPPTDCLWLMLILDVILA